MSQEFEFTERDFAQQVSVQDSFRIQPSADNSNTVQSVGDGGDVVLAEEQQTEELLQQNSADIQPIHTVSSHTYTESFDQWDEDEEEEEKFDSELPSELGPIEDSWQYLGELPYRRILIYDRMQWGSTTDLPASTSITALLDANSEGTKAYARSSPGRSFPVSIDKKYYHKGLVCIPRTALPKQKHPPQTSQIQTSHNSKSHISSFLDPAEYHQYVSTTTVTHVAACPCGGPIATITVPISTVNQRLMNPSSSYPLQSLLTPSPSSSSTHSELRIMTQSGRLLTSMEFPPKNIPSHYTASDLFSMGFTSQYILILIFRDSFCLTYDLAGNFVMTPFSILLPHASHSTPHSSGMMSSEIVQSAFFDRGVAVFTEGMSCSMIEILEQDADKEYATQGSMAFRRRIDPASKDSNRYFILITSLPTAAYAAAHYLSYITLAVLPRIHTSTRHPEIFLSTSDHSIVICDSLTGAITDADCRNSFSSPIVLMSFAPNGRFLACFSQNCVLSVLSTSFETKILDFDTSEGSPTPPREMNWCGEDSVVLYWKNLGVLMVGPYGDWLRMPLTKGADHVYIFSEVDCCRVITDEVVEIIQRVPPVTAQLLRIGSLDPGALLLDASDAFENGSPSSDEAARVITKNEDVLGEAIDSCYQAAVREFDSKMQKRLLTAASYGMHFTYRDADWKNEVLGGDIQAGVSRKHMDGKIVKPSPKAIQFVNTARKIRVMNALRDISVGFVITSAQYDLITPSGVVARLIAMRKPAVATAICRYLQLDRFVHAACRSARASAFVRVDKEHTDADTAERAIKILNEAIEVDLFTGLEAKYLNRGCYAAVALAANLAGRPGVSNLLLIMETNIEDKVNALLQLGSFSDAASVAVHAKDIDLIFKCIVEYEKSCSMTNPDPSKTNAIYLSNVVAKFPSEALNLLIHYYSHLEDVKYVMNALLKSQRFVAAGTTMAKKALERSKDRDRMMLLQEASRIYGLSRDAGFQKSCTDEQLELLSEQEKLLAMYPDLPIKNTSVSTTIFNIIGYAGMKPRESPKLLAEAEKIAKKFKLSEKRLWHLKVQAYAECDQWAALWALSDSKTKAPIGLKYFALEAIKHKQSEEVIMKYIDRITESEERYELLCEASFWKRAVDEAMKVGDKGKLVHIRSVCGSPVIQQLCDDLI